MKKYIIIGIVAIVLVALLVGYFTVEIDYRQEAQEVYTTVNGEKKFDFSKLIQPTKIMPPTMAQAKKVNTDMSLVEVLGAIGRPQKLVYQGLVHDVYEFCLRDGNKAWIATRSAAFNNTPEEKISWINYSERIWQSYEDYVKNNPHD